VRGVSIQPVVPSEGIRFLSFAPSAISPPSIINRQPLLPSQSHSINYQGFVLHSHNSAPSSPHQGSTHSTTMSRTACRSKQALLRGLRPNPSSPQKIQCGVCTHHCIFCDIWKLATLVASHALSSVPTSPKLQHRTSTPSPSTYDNFDCGRSQRAIEAQFQTQRAQLASIMSICTVDGAEESEGLRIAHDRCLGSVRELMKQEQMLAQRRALTSPSLRSPTVPSMMRRPSNGCGESRGYYQDERTPSMIWLAM